MVPQARPAGLMWLPTLHPEEAAGPLAMLPCLQAHLPLMSASHERMGSELPAAVRACFQCGLDEAGRGAGSLLFDNVAPMADVHPGRAVGPSPGPEVPGPERPAWLLGSLQDKQDQQEAMSAATPVSFKE